MSNYFDTASYMLGFEYEPEELTEEWDHYGESTFSGDSIWADFIEMSSLDGDMDLWEE